jgi:hypothetical protein
LGRSPSSTTRTRKPRLIEIVPRSAPPTFPARYVVRVGDAAIEVGDDFRDETLTRVVRLLRAC